MDLKFTGAGALPFGCCYSVVVWVVVLNGGGMDGGCLGPVTVRLVMDLKFTGGGALPVEE